MDIDWTHVATAVSGFIVGFAPTAKRIMKNLGKTEVELADEALHSAVEAQQRAHANADPNDDAIADARVERAEAIRAKAKRLQAIADAVAEETKKP